MPGNRAVAYLEPGHVVVETIEYPKLELQDGPGVNPANIGRKTPHGVILKVVATNICGSDQHMVRGARLPQAVPRAQGGTARSKPLRPTSVYGFPFMLGFKNDLATCMTLLELSIGIANIGKRIDPSDRDLEAAGGQQPS